MAIIVGVLVMPVVARLPVPATLDRRADDFALRHRGLFYAILFLVTSQVASTFVDSRALPSALGIVMLLQFDRM